MQIYKSIIVQEDNDFSIIKHHIQALSYEFECSFKAGNIIDFYDEYLYTTIKEFMNHTKIKSKFNKDIT